MPRLIHRQVTTIQIVSVELTWAEDDVAGPPASETSTTVRRRRKLSRKLTDVPVDSGEKVEFIETED